jgi:hypothetical protein
MLAHVVRVLMIVPLQPISFRFGVFTPHRPSISRQKTRPPSPRKTIGLRYSHCQCGAIPIPDVPPVIKARLSSHSSPPSLSEVGPHNPLL